MRKHLDSEHSPIYSSCNKKNLPVVIARVQFFFF